MEAIGTDELDASAVLEFFKPLNDFIEKGLSTNEEKIGWRSTYKNLLIDDLSSVDNTVPIIVGCVLGAMVIAVIIAYFIGRSRNRKKHAEKERRGSGYDNRSATP